MEPSSDSSCSVFHTADTDSEHQTPSQNTESIEMEVDMEERPMCSADCQQKNKKRFTVKKWNAVAMWAWGKPIVWP